MDQGVLKRTPWRPRLSMVGVAGALQRHRSRNWSLVDSHIIGDDQNPIRFASANRGAASY